MGGPAPDGAAREGQAPSLPGRWLLKRKRSSLRSEGPVPAWLPWLSPPAKQQRQQQQAQQASLAADKPSGWAGGVQRVKRAAARAARSWCAQGQAWAPVTHTALLVHRLAAIRRLKTLAPAAGAHAGEQAAVKAEQPPRAACAAADQHDEFATCLGSDSDSEPDCRPRKARRASAGASAEPQQQQEQLQVLPAGPGLGSLELPGGLHTRDQVRPAAGPAA